MLSLESKSLFIMQLTGLHAGKKKVPEHRMTSVSDWQHSATAAHPLLCTLWPTDDLVSMQREIYDQLSNLM